MYMQVLTLPEHMWSLQFLAAFVFLKSSVFSFLCCALCTIVCIFVCCFFFFLYPWRCQFIFDLWVWMSLWYLSPLFYELLFQDISPSVLLLPTRYGCVCNIQYSGTCMIQHLSYITHFVGLKNNFFVYSCDSLLTLVIH